MTSRPPTAQVLALSGKGFGTETNVPAADATAWSLVALLVFCVACFILAALVIKRRRRPPHPLDELQAEPKGDANRGASGKRAAWQKPDDWWKGGSGSSEEWNLERR